MKKFNKMLLAIALVAALSLGVSSIAKAGAFGDPDPVTGSMVMGWFDIAATGSDNVLPVIVNMSATDLGVKTTTTWRVHLILWNVKSLHVWDKNLALSPWDAYSTNIRGIITDELSPADRALVTETVTINGVEQQRYRGYWTATVVRFATGGFPYMLEYPHAYANILGGWVYVVDLAEGKTDGYAMVSVEAEQLWANDIETTFMYSFSADFWNRPWWWINNAYNQDPTQITTVGPFYSVLWDCNEDQAFVADPDATGADFHYGAVYERFDATSCINTSLLTTGKIITSDDTWLGRQFPCEQKPYASGSQYSQEALGGMLLYARYFRNPSGGTITNFNNRLVLWCDTNSTGRSVGMQTCDEDENCVSRTLVFPDELNVVQFDDILPPTQLAGYVYFHTRDINSPGAMQRMISYWRSVIDTPGNPVDDGYYNCAGNTINLRANGFLPDLVDCSLEGLMNAQPFGNALQILGWTTNEGIGSAAESWGAIFPLIRRCILGSPADIEAVGHSALPFVPEPLPE